MSNSNLLQGSDLSSADRCLAARAAQSRRKSCGRLHGLRRVFVLIDLLRVRRFPAGTNELMDEVNDRMTDSYHYRTILRDLKMLHSAGLVSKTERIGEKGVTQSAWGWLGFDCLHIDGGFAQ